MKSLIYYLILITGMIRFCHAQPNQSYEQAPLPYQGPPSPAPYQQQQAPYQQAPFSQQNLYPQQQMSPRIPQPGYAPGYNPYRQAPPTAKDFSLIFIEEPKPTEFKVNDLVQVIVSEKSEVTLNSKFNRQRTNSLTAELNEFIRLTNGGLTLENSAATSPSIDGSQQERIQSTGQVTDSEGITYRIAATIVDIRPNGNLVLEARKKIQANDDLWEYTLHGEVRFEDVSSNNTVLSENIANLNIEKRQKGRVYSSVARRWGTKFFDWVWPF